MGSPKVTESQDSGCGRSIAVFFWIFYVRDVGVAGSNPVTPTTDSKVFFERTFLLGATFEHIWGRRSNTSGGAPGGETQSTLLPARTGDPLVVWKLDRLGRSVKGLAIWLMASNPTRCISGA